MLFASLQNRLISHIRGRIRAGELSERGLAILSGLSQPHLHNVLKGVRSLSVDSADRLITFLQISVLDLFTAAELGVATVAHRRGTHFEVPRLRGLVGPGLVLDPHAYPGEVYPVAQLISHSLANPVIVALGHDSRLFPYFQAGDLALATCAPFASAAIEPSALYLVRAQESTLIRSVRLGGARLYLATPDSLGEPRKWDQLPLRGQTPQDVILGKLVWLERHLREEPFRRPSVIPIPSSGKAPPDR